MEDIKKTWSKYCIVPMCQNKRETAPEKVYFYVPKNEDKRKKWFKAMKRKYVSSLSSLYCCEDHFNIEEDTENYMQYKLMTLQHGKKVTLRLKKDVIPYKFQCQEKKQQVLPLVRIADIEKKTLALVEDPLAATSLPIPDSSTISVVYLADASPSLASAPYENLELNISGNKINGQAAYYILSNARRKNIMRINKAVQVNCKVQCRNIGVNVNLSAETHDRAKSPIQLPIKNEKRKNPSRSLLKSKQNSRKRKSSFDNSADVSVIDYKPEPSSSNSSLLFQSDGNLQSKFLICSGTLTVIEQEPQMLLGLP